MSYRTIDVNGTTYRYVVGKNYTKIRGVVGACYNAFIGEERDRGVYRVTPSIVRGLIEGTLVPRTTW